MLKSSIIYGNLTRDGSHTHTHTDGTGQSLILQLYYNPNIILNEYVQINTPKLKTATVASPSFPAFPNTPVTASPKSLDLLHFRIRVGLSYHIDPQYKSRYC